MPVFLTGFPCNDCSPLYGCHSRCPQSFNLERIRKQFYCRDLWSKFCNSGGIFSNTIEFYIEQQTFGKDNCLKAYCCAGAIHKGRRRVKGEEVKQGYQLAQKNQMKSDRGKWPVRLLEPHVWYSIVSRLTPG